MAILTEESSLQEIVRLVGIDSLSPEDQLTLDTAKSLREDFLQQNAFDDIDTYCSMEKQYKMLNNILRFHDLGNDALQHGVYLKEIQAMPVRNKIVRMRNVPEEKLDQLDQLLSEVKNAFSQMISEREVENA